MPNLFENGQAVLEKKIFKFCQCIFLLIRNYLPLKKVFPFILTNLSAHPSLVEIGPVVGEYFLLFRQYIFAIS